MIFAVAIEKLVIWLMSLFVNKPVPSKPAAKDAMLRDFKVLLESRLEEF